MAGTEVNTGRLLEVAKSVEDIIGRYNSSVNNVYQIGGEIDKMWDGDASRKFMTILGNDRQKFDALTKMLTAYVETLRQSAATYKKAEDEVNGVLNTTKP